MNKTFFYPICRTMPFTLNRRYEHNFFLPDLSDNVMYTKSQIWTQLSICRTMPLLVYTFWWTGPVRPSGWDLKEVGSAVPCVCSHQCFLQAITGRVTHVEKLCKTAQKCHTYMKVCLYIYGAFRWFLYFLRRVLPIWVPLIWVPCIKQIRGFLGSRYQ